MEETFGKAGHTFVCNIKLTVNDATGYAVLGTIPVADDRVKW
jgi:hypothetical protein